jgi:hypothetical protein
MRRIASCAGRKAHVVVQGAAGGAVRNKVGRWPVLEFLDVIAAAAIDASTRRAVTKPALRVAVPIVDNLCHVQLVPHIVEI